MKHLAVLMSILFLFSATSSPLSAESAAVATAKKVIAGEPAAKEKKSAINVETLETNALNELSDSTKVSLEEEKKKISQTVVAGKKALVEKNKLQNKVENVAKELEKTKAALQQNNEKKSQSDINKLKKKSTKLKHEYQNLKLELEEKNKKAIKAFKQSTQQQEEINKLKTQLEQLELARTQRYKPRKKALIIGAIILSTMFILFIKDKIISLFENWLIRRGKRGQLIRALRARTFLRIFSWAITILIIAIAVFMILELFGFDSTTTLAGAGVFSVAIGFGAQQFIKDVFSGLFLVLEGQYGVNDFVSVGNYSGNVEDINLRFTKLRNYDGNVIYIPNGDIHSVVNYGKGYANAVINFYIDVEQDIDSVFSLIRESVADLRNSADLKAEILSDVELLGINDFTTNGIEIKFRLRTAPQSQWLVGREVRLALKQRFDLDGIKLFQYQCSNQWQTSL